jgi:transglutaminase-like putative cysteine protease
MALTVAATDHRTAGLVTASGGVPLLAIALIGSLPGLALAGVVDGDASILVASTVALAATTTTAAVLATANARRPTRWVTLATATTVAIGALLVSFAVAAAWPASDATRRALVPAVLDAWWNGWSALITTPVPADAQPRLLVPIALLVWASTSAGVATALRSAAPVAPLVPGAVALVAASVAAGANQQAPAVTGLAFAVASGLFLAARARTPGTSRRGSDSTADGPTPTGVIASIGVAAVATTLGLVAGPTLTFGRDPFDPRDHWRPPTVPAGATSPLELVAGYLQEPNETMFAVRSSEPLHTRLVAFDSFDGARWSTSAAYQRVGGAIARPAREGVDLHPVTAEVVVTGLPGPWLPSIGDPTRLTGVSALVDPASGSIVIDGGGSGKIEYTIAADLPRPELAVLQTAPVADDAEAVAASVVAPNLPDELGEMAAVATRGATSPLTQAALLERYLRLNYTLDEQASGGHAHGHLRRALTVTNVGTSEQFATAFAVLGRVVGLPTRVVVGFGPGEESAPGMYTVRSGDVRVWPEVRFGGVGWVAFDPTPARGGGAGSDDGTVSIGVGGGQELVVQQGEPRPASIDDEQPGPAEPQARGDEPGRSRLLLVATIVVAALTALAMAIAIAVVVAKRRRTARRRQAAQPADRVVGAWHDVLDRMLESGVNQPGNRTVGELVGATNTTTAALTGMYRPVNRALYGDAGVTTADAEQAWRGRDRFVERVRREARWRQRVQWAVDPRPITRRPSARRGELSPPPRRSDTIDIVNRSRTTRGRGALFANSSGDTEETGP